MIRNYFKIAFRYLKTHQTYTLVNLIGLTLGFLCFLILNAYVSSERNFDTQHGNVFRLLQSEPNETGAVKEIATLGPRIGYASKENFPEVVATTEILQMGRLTVGNDPGNRSYERMQTIDKDFFTVFQFNLLEGTEEQVFSQANGIVITKKLRNKYFGDQPAIGKTLFTNSFEAVVAGVIEDFPTNTHLEGNLIIPAQTAATNFNWWDEFISTNWHRNTFLTYFKLRPEANLASLENKITQLCKENWPQEQEFKSSFTLQPVQDIHLYAGEVAGEINKSKGNLFYIRTFFWIALVILLVACFNYTGLLNVAYMGRAKEIGIRKAIGADRRQLLSQFFFESLVLTSLALLLAYSIFQFSAPFLPTYFGPAFDISTIPLNKLVVIALFGLGISLLSIAYPSYLISRLAIVEALNKGAKKYHGLSLRKVITVFQFVAAITLIACTSILYRQINYLQAKELGFDMEGLVIIDINSGSLRSQFQAIKQEFAKLPEVSSTTVSSRVPGEWKNFPYASVQRAGQTIAESQEMIFIGADQDFIPTYNLHLQQGNNFTGNLTDSSKVLLNQTAVANLGLTDPIGKWIEIPQANWSGDIETFAQPYRAQVAGVVEDFHFEDFRKSIEPMVIGFWSNPVQNIDYYSLRVSTSDWGSTMASLSRINNSFDAENPMEFNILNDQFQRFFEADILRSRLLLFFSGIVIFIACLGLFAMTAFVLKNRTKEIGIRKVLGASISQIIAMITGDFIKLVLLGTVIAIPVSWMLMNRWLDEFAYRIPLSWWLFASAGFVVLVVAAATVSIQSARAAMVNPTESLQQE